MRNPPRLSLWIGLLALVCVGRATAPAWGAHFDDPRAAVEGGRKALDHWVDYPWYDDANDRIARIEIRPEKDYQTPSFNWSFLADMIRGLGWLLLAVIIFIILWFVIRAFLERERRSVRGAAADEADRLIDAARVEALPFPVDRPLDGLLAEARRLYAAGNYEQAIIYLYSYELVELDKHHVIRLERGKTNRQYLRETRKKSGPAGLLETTMVAFEDVFFGKHALGRERFEICWGGVESFLAQIRREVT